VGGSANPNDGVEVCIGTGMVICAGRCCGGGGIAVVCC